MSFSSENALVQLASLVQMSDASKMAYLSSHHAILKGDVAETALQIAWLHVTAGNPAIATRYVSAALRIATALEDHDLIAEANEGYAAVLRAIADGPAPRPMHFTQALAGARRC